MTTGEETEDRKKNETEMETLVETSHTKPPL